MAQDLELKIDSSKYQARISQLENYVSQLEGLVGEYQNMKNRVTDFMDSSSIGFESMQQNVEERIGRVRRSIEATQSQIKTLQRIVENNDNLGSNISTILDEGLKLAASGLFE